MINDYRKMYLIDKYRKEYTVKDSGDIDIIHAYLPTLKKTNSSITVFNENHKSTLLKVKEINSYFIVEKNYLMIMLNEAYHR